MASCAWCIGSRNVCPDIVGCGRGDTTEGMVGAGWTGVGGATGGTLKGGVQVGSELDGVGGGRTLIGGPRGRIGEVVLWPGPLWC